MRGFIFRRGALLLGTLAVAGVAIYVALDLAPGDPIAVLTGGRQVTPEARALLTARYHLDDPLPVRYWYWLTSALQGDFGYSLAGKEDVSTLIAQRAPTTIELVAYASLIIVVVGIGIGVLSALKPGLVDTAALLVTTVLAAIPSFVAALILISIFAVNLNWFPALGEGEGFADQIVHLTLPAVALACSSLALVARITRASVRDEAKREHVHTAISRGLPYRAVLRRHILRNAAIPITTVTGLTIATLIVLVSIVEQAFNLNGLGSTLVTAAQNKDFAVVQAVSLLMVVAFVIVNGIVDVLYALLDPRVSLGTAAA
ncbi:ABC transporter permease [Rhodococcus koreensis]|uniref:Peptide/nickel transport system permease protein n=1 Tax=Rhodococcus koreensis TaxID=99653 RepID=A0A1H5CBM8_9NOCA|nr:ABC transporter permease [Rhodococcus koreensis]SED63911.1 peptide/nickel transport system permease protein [Rhodococcus koreensis]